MEKEIVKELKLIYRINEKGYEKLVSVFAKREESDKRIKLNKMEAQLLSSTPQFVKLSLGNFVLSSNYGLVKTNKSAGRYVRYKKADNFDVNSPFLEQYDFELEE